MPSTEGSSPSTTTRRWPRGCIRPMPPHGSASTSTTMRAAPTTMTTSRRGGLTGPPRFKVCGSTRTTP
jgi:hypothetical protein